MNSLARALAGASMTGVKRSSSDFYPTPPQPIESLLHFYRDILVGKSFHEGSCGDGALARVMTNRGYNVHSTDLIERGHGDDLFGPKGFGTSGIDFLKIDPKRYPLKQYSTVMNPPFNLWKEFAFKCHELQMPFIALFAKQTIWNAAARFELYEKYPPKAIHPLTWRVDFDGRGCPTMDCCWVVWGDEVPFSNQPLKRLDP